MSNKKVLSKATRELNKTKRLATPKNIIEDPRGQWAHPGEITRIPSENITMQGVPYPVMAYPNIGEPQMMYPGGEYNFPGADYVDEYPELKKGGTPKSLVRMPKPSKKSKLSKKFSSSLDATNKIFTEHFLFAKPKSKKRKVFDPNAQYQDGGEAGCPPGYAFNPVTGECIEWNPTVWDSEEEPTSYDPIGDIVYMNPNDRPEGMSDEEYAQMYQDQIEHEQLHRLQWINGGLKGNSGTPLRIPSTVDNQEYDGEHYYNRRGEEESYLHDMFNQDNPELAKFIPNDVIYDKVINPSMYDIPWTEEGEARGYEGALHNGMQSLFPKRKKGGALLTKKITCKKCGWEWDASDGGDDITTCHKCGGQGLIHAQEGGTAASPFDLDPEQMKKYLADLKIQENGIKKGFKSGKWYPHRSVEGGTDTIAYGHKLTSNESNLRKGITEDAAVKLLEGDVLKNQALAKKQVDKKYGAGTFDSLPQDSQMLLVDFQYNLGTLSKFPSFVDATIKGDKEKMIAEHERYGAGELLTKRNKWTTDVINNMEIPKPYDPMQVTIPQANVPDATNVVQPIIFPGPDESIELELTPEEIKQYQMGGYIVEDVEDIDNIAQDGGQIYTYAQRPGSYYKKDENGKWLIKNEGTKGKYVVVDDPKGTRTKALNAGAKPIPSKKPVVQKSNYDALYDTSSVQKANTTQVNNLIKKDSPFNTNPLTLKKPTAKQIQQKKYNDSLKYTREYMQSPKYKEMLKKSTKSADEYNHIYKNRLENLESIPSVEILKEQPIDMPMTAAYSRTRDGKITMLPRGYDSKGTFAHELSHSVDRPTGFLNKLLDVRNNIPESDRDYINNHKAKSLLDSREYDVYKIQKKYDPNMNYENANKDFQEFYTDYVGEDTETRARLNAIRQGAKESGLYDPFTQGVSPDLYYKKLKNFRFQDGELRGLDPMDQLKSTFSDEEIIWMLNNISKNQDNKEELNTAQDGGSVYTYAGRPGSYYQKRGSKWFISNSGTNGEYVPLQDPDGKRTALLNKSAVKVMSNPTPSKEEKYKNLPSYGNSPMIASVKGRTEAERKQVDDDIQSKAILDKMQKEFKASQKDALPQHEQPLVAQDWIWTLPMMGGSAMKSAGTAIADGMGAVGTKVMPYVTGALETSLPFMKSIPGATVGNALGAGFAVDAAVNRLPKLPGQIARGEYIDAAENALTGGLDVLGAGIVSPIYEGARGAMSGLKKFVGTEEGLLSNAYKYNPFAFKPNPNAYYRGIGEAGMDDALTTGVLRPNRTGTGLTNNTAYDAVFFDKGRTRLADALGRGNIAEVRDIPMKEFSPDHMGVAAFDENTGKFLSEIPLGDNTKLLKRDWLRGYKEVPVELPGSVNNSASVNKGILESIVEGVTRTKERDALNSLELQSLNETQLGQGNAMNLFDDFKREKLSDLESAEGNRRIQKYIDDNQLGQTVWDNGNYEDEFNRIDKTLDVNDPEVLTFIEGIKERAKIAKASPQDLGYSRIKSWDELTPEFVTKDLKARLHLVDEMVRKSPDFTGSDKIIPITTDDYIKEFKKMSYEDVQDKIQQRMIKLKTTNDQLDLLKLEERKLRRAFDEGQVPITAFMPELKRLKNSIQFNQDNLRDLQRQAIALKDKLNLDNASHSYGNEVFIGNPYTTVGDLQQTMQHEAAGHGLNTPFLGFDQSTMVGRNSALDKELINGLDLKKTAPKHLLRPINVKEVSEAAPYNVTRLGIQKAKNPKSYFKAAKDYFKKGNTGIDGMSKEPVAFAAEVRNSLRERNVIGSDYDNITPEMLEQHYNEYIESPLYERNLRLFDIMDPTKKSFKVLSEVLNNMKTVAPYAVPVGIGVGAASGNEELQEEMQYQDGGIIMELSDDEIQQYANGGFIVEELDYKPNAGRALNKKEAPAPKPATIPKININTEGLSYKPSASAKPENKNPKPVVKPKPQETVKVEKVKPEVTTDSIKTILDKYAIGDTSPIMTTDVFQDIFTKQEMEKQAKVEKLRRQIEASQNQIKKQGTPTYKYKEEHIEGMPNIRTTESASYLQGSPLKNEVKKVVLHHTGSTDEKNNNKYVHNHFMNPKSETSSHIVIEEDGQRTIYASPDQVTFHAGKSSWDGRSNVNDFGIGVEFQGDTNLKPLTDAQIESFVEYFDQLAKQYKISTKDIITHAMVAPGRKPDITEREYKKILKYLKDKGYK